MRPGPLSPRDLFPPTQAALTPSTLCFRPKKETAYTSFLKNESNPVWEGERLQLALAPGGVRPLKLSVEIWDKDQHTADDMIAHGELELNPHPASGTVTLPLPAVEPGQPAVNAFTFSYEFKEVPEEAQRTKRSSLSADEKTAAKAFTDAGKEGRDVKSQGRKDGNARDAGSNRLKEAATKIKDAKKK